MVIASASGDGVVRLWRATTNSLVIAGYFVAQGSVTALCVAQASLGEAQTFVGFDSGLIEAWPIDAEQLTRAKRSRRIWIAALRGSFAGSHFFGCVAVVSFCVVRVAGSDLGAVEGHPGR